MLNSHRSQEPESESIRIRIFAANAKKLTRSLISPIICHLYNNISSRPIMTFFDRLTTPSARYLLFIVCLTLIAYVSLLPSTLVESDIPKNIQAYDIPFHFFIYFILTLTAIFAFAIAESSVRHRINIFLVCSSIGALLEIMQATVPGINRNCTVVDFLSNSTGAVLAAVIFPVKMLISKTKPILFRP